MKQERIEDVLKYVQGQLNDADGPFHTLEYKLCQAVVAYEARVQLLAKALREAEAKLEQCKGKCEGIVDVLMSIEDALKEAGLEG